MAQADIVVQPSLEDAGRNDWLVMSMPVHVPVEDTHPDPRPTAEWFEHMKSVRPDTEREVEIHFASQLFQDGLGYREEQEAAGFGIKMSGEAFARSTSRPTCFTSLITGTARTLASHWCSSSASA